jgi:hypothetical protein
MDTNATIANLDQAGEEVLTDTISDELEAAAEMEGGALPTAFTFCYSC